MQRFVLTGCLTIATVLIAAPSRAQIGVWDQGFESDTSGWNDRNGPTAWAGLITQTASGTDGIVSADGAFHAIVKEDGDSSAPFSRFDGYRDTWPGEMTASIDIYLDTSWATGTGFDYSVAANGTDGEHVQDFIFHVTQDTSTGNLLVGGSNNSGWQTDDLRENLENGSPYQVNTSGWYTFEHRFYDAGGNTFVVDMNLYDSVGSQVFTQTLPIIDSGVPVTLAELGGNRYGWFTMIEIADGVAIDNHQLEIVPEPGVAALVLTALGGAFLRRRSRA